MHGRQRRLTEKSEEEIKAEEIKAAKLKRAGMTVLEKINSKEYSTDVFQLTSVVAKLNPDFYSIWNYRKDYLDIQLANPSLDEDMKIKLLKGELSITEDIIRDKDPKCYSVWHHRRWLFEKDSSLLEEREISLCEALLKKDQRNFHCWNHWMLVCQKMGLGFEQQLAFTWNRINENASNYSAWHFRVQLLKPYLQTKSSEEILQILASELEVNLNALYTECDDQSSWYYMRSLFTLARELQEEGKISVDDVDDLIAQRLEELCELTDFAPDCLYGETFLGELQLL